MHTQTRAGPQRFRYTTTIRRALQAPAPPGKSQWSWHHDGRAPPTPWPPGASSLPPHHQAGEAGGTDDAGGGYDGGMGRCWWGRRRCRHQGRFHCRYQRQGWGRGPCSGTTAWGLPQTWAPTLHATPDPQEPPEPQIPLIPAAQEARVLPWAQAAPADQAQLQALALPQPRTQPPLRAPAQTSRAPQPAVGAVGARPMVPMVPAVPGFHPRTGAHSVALPGVYFPGAPVPAMLRSWVLLMAEVGFALGVRVVRVPVGRAAPGRWVGELAGG